MLLQYRHVYEVHQPLFMTAKHLTTQIISLFHRAF